MIRTIISLLILLSSTTQASELKTLQVSHSIMPLERFLEGSVEAISQATVSAETSGRVEQILVDIGDQVPAGKVILKLVGIDQKENLIQAEAGLTEANSQNKVEAEQFSRIKTLFAQKLVSKANYDSALANFNTAKARVVNAKAALKRAQQLLSYTEIKAAYSGVVSARYVEVGEAVQPGVPLMSGFDPDHLRVLVDLPQSIARGVGLNPSVRVILGDDTAIQPVKSTLFPIANSATGTVRMRIDLPASIADIYPGQLVKVALQIGEKARLLVPATSIVYHAEVAGVYVLSNLQGDSLNPIPRFRQLRVGNRFANQLEILAGLMPGELIATDPVAAGILAANANGQKE